LYNTAYKTKSPLPFSFHLHTTNFLQQLTFLFLLFPTDPTFSLLLPNLFLFTTHRASLPLTNCPCSSCYLQQTQPLQYFFLPFLSSSYLQQVLLLSHKSKTHKSRITILFETNTYYLIQIPTPKIQLRKSQHSLTNTNTKPNLPPKQLPSITNNYTKQTNYYYKPSPSYKY
ncbi:unnamed protein product, partial [Ascophyllum nodosum]